MELLNNMYLCVAHDQYSMHVSLVLLLLLVLCFKSVIMLGDAQQVGFGSCKQKLQEDPRESRFVFHCCFSTD